MAVSCQSLGKVYLRPPKMADLVYYQKWWQEPLSNYLDLGRQNSKPSSKAVADFKKQVKTRYVPGWFTIVMWDDFFKEIPVGYIRYRQVEWKKRRTEIAIRLGRDHWGKEIGQVAIGELLAYLFFEKGLEEAWLKVASFNQRAIRLYEKCGFIETGKMMDSEYPELTWKIMSIHKTKFARLSP
ncbi:GNAT family N-acetyltransferase [Natranaerobius thermophilus]|uniref:GCN5-related N-acetyltransferase n=1 Tax=Natranaerobius thermophilus (strain ATCC BAA-1301 / DSM 18059 / JW/NM-WN-LF) TaxID=457570 RepID=B2A673_NATTJ|nr:GNAT family protein [Natranaerobius thermophilus]ACB84084.1 GCN5-related N-acetyltransferase [Natranaerobius thermophilus JW/NM-WN-LF]